MIGTVTLNPCVDRTCKIEGLLIGGMNRMLSDRRDVSGKGINVSIALLQNGMDVRTSGFLFSDGKEQFLNKLHLFGIDYQGIEVKGRVRENLKLWDVASSVTTEINQKGAFVEPTRWDAFKKAFPAFLKGLELLVLSGSVPPGIAPDAYRTLIEMASSQGVPTILDAEGDLLREGLKAHPLLIKPNLHEFVSTFRLQDIRRQSVVDEARTLIKKGCCSSICITLGEEGAMLFDAKGAWYCACPSFPVKCTQGAGDSVVAGLCKAMVEKKGEVEMLRSGVAMASGTISREGTLLCLPEDYARFSSLITIKELT
jgi:1-phosphofructokinase